MRFHSWEAVFDILTERMRNAPIIHTGSWQGLSTSHNPAGATHELLNVFVSAPVSPDLEVLQAHIQPNLPWADVHHNERVGGKPVNPPPSYKIWPWTQSSERFKPGGLFDACYPERIWPKYARSGAPRKGIEGLYGDLGDVVELLRQDPLTRRAYLPLFHPDDTGVGEGRRTMCSLGYGFIQRMGQLHMTYTMRSCDYAHHLRDDIYLAARMLLWVCDQLNVPPGDLTVLITSLHCFVNDHRLLFPGAKHAV